ncbi:MAG: hypothetical protein ACTSU5_16055 [Promethearchaeota archaeon]
MKAILKLVEDRRVKEAIDKTKAILLSGDDDFKEALVDKLSVLYKQSPAVVKTLVPELLENFDIEEDLTRYALILSLKDLANGDPELILPFSHEFIADRNPNKREGMLRLVSFIALNPEHADLVREYLDEVISCLRDEEPHVRNQAKETLKICGRTLADEIRPKLLEILKAAEDEELKSAIEEVLQSFVHVKTLGREEIEELQAEAIEKELESKEQNLEKIERKLTQKELEEKERILKEKELELQRLEEERKRQEAEKIEKERKRKELEEKLKELKEKEELLRQEEIRRMEEELAKKTSEIELEAERRAREELEAALREKQSEVEKLEKQLKLEELRRKEEELRRQQEIARKQAELRLVEQELQMKELEQKEEEIKKKEKERIEKQLKKLMDEVDEGDYQPYQ